MQKVLWLCIFSKSHRGNDLIWKIAATIQLSNAGEKREWMEAKEAEQALKLSRGKQKNKWSMQRRGNENGGVVQTPTKVADGGLWKRREGGEMNKSKSNCKKKQ